MALTHQVALVPEDVSIKPSELTLVASALSKQVARDFGPIWNVQANVDPFATLDEVPSDYWPIIITRKVEDAAGFHDDEHGQPFALVEFDTDWSLTASHECLEMLADPFGRRLRAGNLPQQAVKLGLPDRRVRFLVEVCDPSEGTPFAYHVNGVLVSDFYTPEYFDPISVSSVRYSFTGAIKAPRTVLDDGYISWHDPVTGHWMQLRMFADDLSSKKPHVVDLTTQTPFAKLLQTGISLRSAVDRVTKTAPRLQRAGKAAAGLNRGVTQRAEESSSANAEVWRRQIDRVKAVVRAERSTRRGARKRAR
jgi:hypothetical protein